MSDPRGAASREDGGPDEEGLGRDLPPTTAIADVLALQGGAGWLSPPLRCFTPTQPPTCGTAVTVSMAVGRAANGEAFGDLYALLSRDLTGRVLVVSDTSSVPAGVWGQILSRAARGVGLRMAVINGGVRDIEDLQGEGLAVWGCGEFTVGPAGGVRVVAVGEPVSVAGVTVSSGDLVVADAGGLISLPAAQAHDVLVAAGEYAQAEEAVLADLERGVQLTRAYQRKSHTARRIVQQYNGRGPADEHGREARGNPSGGSP